MTVAVPSLVEGNDADMVAGNHVDILLAVIKTEGEDAVEVFKEINALVAVQGQDDLTVTLCQEFIFTLITLPDLLMVVYLTVCGKDELSILAVKRLLTRKRVYDGKSLMRDDTVGTCENTGPVRSAVADLP